MVTNFKANSALGDSEGLTYLHTKVFCEPCLITGIFHPLIGGENLLDGLRKDNKKTLREISKQKTSMRSVEPS